MHRLLAALALPLLPVLACAADELPGNRMLDAYFADETARVASQTFAGIDTLQLGELQGLHHGTRNEGLWWWNARGYTPAGVESWNSMRALDYLESRPEVDAGRIGMTGRSGGGAYTWFTAALDERVKVAVPVAGVTDLHTHVVDGLITGHCDCMFQLNTYRWDFAKLAARLAPRPLLIANSDKDPIFPLEGVLRVHRDVARIYQLHDAADKLGLLITEGPHRDTQDLQGARFPLVQPFSEGRRHPGFRRGRKNL